MPYEPFLLGVGVVLNLLSNDFEEDGTADIAVIGTFCNLQSLAGWIGTFCNLQSLAG